MDDYKQPYLYLFNQITDAIALIQQSNYGMARAVLIAAQQDAEETFLQKTAEEADSRDGNSTEPVL